MIETIPGLPDGVSVTARSQGDLDVMIHRGLTMPEIARARPRPHPFTTSPGTVWA